jgi:polyphosphate glucokinase
LIRDCLSELNWTGPLGVGYPGVIKRGTIYSAAHVDDRFIGRNWLEELRTLTGSPVALINDADAAGLAEMRFGAGSGQASTEGGTVLVATLGAGIGTAIFHAGHLLPNTELGHMLLGNVEAEDLAAGAVKARENLSWEEFGQRLNLFLSELERLFSPDLVIVGGGISSDFDQFQPFLEVKVPVSAAHFRNRAGLIGAALAVFVRDQA